MDFRAAATRFLAASAVMVSVTLGCGGKPSTAQVSGTVRNMDGTVPQGRVRVVRFEPVGDDPEQIRKTASGEIANDGTFMLYTRKPGDGVYLGNYAVTFSVWKGPMEPDSLIDSKYTRADTTPYKVTVEHDLADLTFEVEPNR